MRNDEDKKLKLEKLHRFLVRECDAAFKHIERTVRLECENTFTELEKLILREIQKQENEDER